MHLPPPNLTELINVMQDRAESDEELDLLAVVEHVHATHQTDSPERLSVQDGPWGSCENCGLDFTCPPWVEIHGLALEWLGHRAGQACASAAKLLRDTAHLYEDGAA